MISTLTNTDNNYWFKWESFRQLIGWLSHCHVLITTVTSGKLLQNHTHRHTRKEDLFWIFIFLIKHGLKLLSRSDLLKRDSSVKYINFTEETFSVCLTVWENTKKKSISESIKVSYWNIIRRIPSKIAILQYPQERRSMVKL